MILWKAPVIRYMRKIVLGIASSVQTSPRVKFARDEVKTFAKPYVFLITSTIRPSKGSLSYTPIRSVYSVEERVEQTLRSIASVRAKVPDVLIVLLENSALSSEETRTFQQAVDWFVSFARDARSNKLRDGLFKGAAETYMLLWIQSIICRFDYEVMFKLSGRYWLSESFSLQSFSREKLGFLWRGDSRSGSYSARLYSVPKSLEAIYHKQLTKTFRQAQMGVSIEATILNGVSHSQIDLLDRLGVCGYIAPTGDWIDE